MEIRQIVHHPLFFQSILCSSLPSPPGRHDIGAQHDHVQSARRGIVDPFCSKETYRVQRGHVYLLSVDELIATHGSQIFNVVDEERVGGGVVREQNDLCPSGREFSSNFSAYP